MKYDKKDNGIHNFQQKNQSLDDFPKWERKVSNLHEKLSLCGRYATKSSNCKICEREGRENSFIGSVTSKFFCEIHYCNHSDCLVARFRRQMETFDDITRFDGLRSLWHFSIGFESIPLDDWKKNFSKHNKRFHSVLNNYWAKLKKAKINLQGVRVLDFSFVSEGMVFQHYHFAVIPIGQNRIRSTMVSMQSIRKQMIDKMRIRTSFIFKNYGLATKQGVLSYLSIRASGMYKYDMTKNVLYRHIPNKLKDSIETKKYLFLSDVMSEEEYVKSFYNKPHFVTVGGLPRPPRHGSNITDSIPSECPIHGHLERNQVRVEVRFDSLFEFAVIPPPSRQQTREEVIEIVRFH